MLTTRTALLGTFALLAFSCAAPPPAPMWQEPPPQGYPEPQPFPASQAPTASCDLLLRANLQATGSTRRRLFVTLENARPTPIELELPNRCPAGPVDFEGLEAGYDYYQTCNAGACPGPQAPQRITLRPGERREIASTEIDFAGVAPCTRPLAAGRYVIRPVLSIFPQTGCVMGAVLDVSAPPPAPPKPPSSPVTHMPSAPNVPPAYACSSPADCVLSCPNVPGCCGDSCGCRHAIRRDHQAAYEASYAKTCTRPPHCPAVGCMYQPAFGATCLNGRCVPVTGATGF